MNKARLGRGAWPARRPGPWCRLPGPAAGSRAVIPAGGIALPLYPAACAVSVSCSVQLADSQPARPGALVCVGFPPGWGGYAVCAHNTAALRQGGRLDNARAQRFLVLGCCSSPGFVIGCVGGQLLGSVARRRSAVRAAAGGQPALRRAARPLAAPARKAQGPRCPASLHPPQQSSFSDAVSQAADSCLHLCGCVVFFRTISGVISRFLPPGLQPLLSAALEISAGCADLAARGGAAALYGCCACLSLLGFSVYVQMQGILQGCVPLRLFFCFPPCALWAFFCSLSASACRFCRGRSRYIPAWLRALWP